MLDKYLENELKTQINELVINVLIDAVMRSLKEVSFKTSESSIDVYIEAISNNTTMEYELLNIGNEKLIVTFI